MKYRTETERIANEVFDRAMTREPNLRQLEELSQKYYDRPFVELDADKRKELREELAEHSFARAIAESMLPHAKFYVNGQPWRPGEEIPSSRLRIASREEQEDFWAHIPQEPIYAERRGFWSLLPRRQMGLGRARIDWRRVRVYFALFGLSLGFLLALAVGVRKLWEAFR